MRAFQYETPLKTAIYSNQYTMDAILNERDNPLESEETTVTLKADGHEPITMTGKEFDDRVKTLTK